MYIIECFGVIFYSCILSFNVFSLKEWIVSSVHADNHNVLSFTQFILSFLFTHIAKLCVREYNDFAWYCSMKIKFCYCQGIGAHML